MRGGREENHCSVPLSCRHGRLSRQKRCAHRVLPKEEKHVRGREVVVRHGGGDRELPLARHGAPQDTVAIANSLRNCVEEHKKKKCQG